MSDWSPEEAIAMEQRHVSEGEKRVCRQETLVREVTERGSDLLVFKSNELLSLLRKSLELSRARLRDLEARYGKAPGRN